MSKTDRQVDDYLFICDFCGTKVERVGRKCPALDDGRCEP